jgi:hypothetical protein
MFDDLRRVGEKIDDVLGSNIFPFNQPFSYTENFLQNLEKWEFAVPNKFMWLVNIEAATTQSSDVSFTQTHPIPRFINAAAMHAHEPGDNGQHSGRVDQPGAKTPGWDIDQGKGEITKDAYMRTGQGHGCILAQGVVLPGERYEINDLSIDNNMGFLPGKIGGNRMGTQPLTVQWRETNRSFVDLVIRPWLMLASHAGLVARPGNDGRNIKANISVVQLAKTLQYVPTVQRKIWRFYNCVPTSIDSKELTYQDGDGANFDIYTTEWHYTHYTIESLPHIDMNKYLNEQGFKKFVKEMAVKLLNKSSAFRKLQKKLKKVEEFVDKAAKVKKKIEKYTRFFQPGQSFLRPGANQPMLGRSATGRFLSDQNNNSGNSTRG